MSKSYLTSNQFSANEDPFGLAASAIAQSAPALYNPYASTGSNVGVALGSALLAGLLGGIANNRTESRNDEFFKLGTQLYDMTPSERASLLESNPDYRRRLSPLAEALQERDITQRMEQQNKLLEQKQSIAKDMGGYYDQTGQFVQLVDPVEQLAKEEQAKAVGKLKGENSFFGLRADENPSSPQYKRKADIFDRETKLRGEYTKNPIVQDFQTSDIGFRSLVKAAQDPHPTADLELVRGAIQAIEPGMAVREGEAAAVEASRSIPDQWKGAINKALLNGASLDKDVREGIIRIAARRYEQYSNQVTALRGQYTSLAETESLAPDKILLGAVPSPVEDIFPQYKTSNTIAGAASQLSDEELEARIREQMNQDAKNKGYYR